MEDCFHLGAKALICNEAGQLLLLWKDTSRRPVPSEPHWDLPGGRVHRGEPLIGALQREVEEETGLTGLTEIRPVFMALSSVRIPRSEGDVGLIFSFYWCRLAEPRDIVLSAEHTACNWFSLEEAAHHLRIQYPLQLTDYLRRRHLECGDLSPLG